MTVSFGPKLGFINNANIGEIYYDQFRLFLQALDQLIQMSVLNASTVSPPASPADGDSYLLLVPSPTGAWTGFFGYIAVWDAQNTIVGTDIRSPAWIFYKPLPGWLVWNISVTNLNVFDGTNWTSIAGSSTQAESPSGVVDGINRNFTLTFLPQPTASLMLFLNGVLQIPTNDYVLSGTTVAMNIAPGSSSNLYAVYDYA